MTRKQLLQIPYFAVGKWLCLTPALLLAAGSTGSAAAASTGGSIEFENVIESVGLSTHLKGWAWAHGGAWGDVTGNGRPDLYIGAFSDREMYGETDAPPPNMLFLNRRDGFTLSSDQGVRFVGDRGRTSMALFAELNNDGRLDLLVGRHTQGPNYGDEGGGPESHLLANAWPHGFKDVTPTGGDWPSGFDMRNATAIDLDEDGLLDLALINGRYRSRDNRVVALRNLGDFRFEDVSEAYGFPPGDTDGLGTAVGDVNNDGRLDLFVAHSNRMFVTQPDGTYRELRPGFFMPEGLHERAWPCGAAFADMTGNGLLDLVFTIHPTGRPTPETWVPIPTNIFLYVNRGIDEHGLPMFENATAASGLGGFALPPYTGDLRDIEAMNVQADDPVQLMLRAAAVYLVDLDHDGRRDVLLGMIREDEQGRIQPVVLRNVGVAGGVPRFELPPLDTLLGYYATAPGTDFDRDGRYDIYLANWFPELESYLFRNVTETGNFLVVRAQGRAPHLNPMGVGAVVRLYEAGHAGSEQDLLGRGDIALANGYSTGDEAMVHFGLGGHSTCDVVLTWQGHEVVLADVEANQYVDIPVGDGR